MTQRVALGRITAVHGLRGEVKIMAFTSNPSDIVAYGSLSTGDGTQTLTVLSGREVKGGVLIARLKGIDTREQAEETVGHELWVDRSALPPPAENEFYHIDLIGLRVLSPHGAMIGKVVALHNFGAGDLLEVQLENSNKTEIVPFDLVHVPEIDFAANTLTLDYKPDDDSDNDKNAR